MKKKFMVIGLVLLLVSLNLSAVQQKVILDTDMVECFDDGVAMILLENSKDIDLLGVTVVAGNTSMPHGVASGVRQLEILNSKTPIYQGSRKGIRNSRVIPEVMAAEELISPVVSWAGYLRTAINPEKYNGPLFDVMADWKDVYRYKYKMEPTYKYVREDAVDFLVEQVNKYPGQIVIAAIGPLTNIARAIMKDPSFPSKVKEIVYMGGSFYIPGNSSASAEFNWWADPDAAKICVRSSWGNKYSMSYKNYGNQMISGLEANANTGGMPQDVFDKAVRNMTPGLRDLFVKNYGTKAPNNIWDVLAVGYIIDPSIVLSWNNKAEREDGSGEPINGVYIDVNAEMGPDYGRSLAFRADKGPVGSQKAAIQSHLDEDKFWNKIVYPLLTQ
jgi:inosine-uridine nucleoside N-ribohydrolase